MFQMTIFFEGIPAVRRFHLLWHFQVLDHQERCGGNRVSGKGTCPHVLRARLVLFLCIAMLKVLLHWTDDVTDPQHAVSLDALRRLEGFVDAKGRPLKV